MFGRVLLFLVPFAFWNGQSNPALDKQSNTDGWMVGLVEKK